MVAIRWQHHPNRPALRLNPELLFHYSSSLMTFQLSYPQVEKTRHLLLLRESLNIEPYDVTGRSFEPIGSESSLKSDQSQDDQALLKPPTMVSSFRYVLDIFFLYLLFVCCMFNLFIFLSSGSASCLMFDDPRFFSCGIAAFCLEESTLA